MLKYIAKRLVLLIPVLIGVTFFVFTVLSLAPFYRDFFAHSNQQSL